MVHFFTGREVSTVLEELAEDRVSGELAAIYDEIRQTTRVPYVSSLQRHLATHPGFLQWAWQVVGQSFREGRAQATGWTVAKETVLPTVAGVTKLDGILHDKAEVIDQIANVYESFIRVSPTNLVVSCILKHRLAGTTAQVESTASSTQRLPSPGPLPPMLAPLPSLADHSALSEPVQKALNDLAVVVGGKPFVPGLYRILANWPDYLVHVSQALGSVKKSGQLDNVLQSLPAKLDQQSLLLQCECPLVDPPVTPGSTDALKFIDVIDSYRRTSPEMIIYSKYLLQQLREFQER